MSRHWLLSDRPSIWRTALTTLLAVLATGRSAGAQSATGRYEMAVGFRRVEAVRLGTTDANETNPAGGEFRLFTAESRLGAIGAIEARFGIRVSDSVRVEATGSYGTSELSVELRSDVEGIPDTTAIESIRQFTMEGALTMDLTRWQMGSRAMPFFAAGAGYVRDLHEEQILVDHGTLWHLGGGLNVFLRSNSTARMKSAGLRLDGRVLFRSGGVIFDDGVHTSPAVGASFFVRF